MKNWKTTLSGGFGGLSSILAGVKLCMAGNLGEGFALIGTGLGVALAGFHASDKPKE